MDLLMVKIIVLTLSGVIRLIFGLVPIIIMKTVTRRFSSFKSSKRIKYVISLLMFFGGGVLLATCFLHMMPEVRESIEEAQLNSELPVAELIFIAGFFLVYILEDIIHGIVHRRRLNKVRHGHEPSYETSQLDFKNGKSGAQNLGFSSVEALNTDTNTTFSENVLTEDNAPVARTLHISGNKMNGIIPRVRSQSSKTSGGSDMHSVPTSIRSIPATHEICLGRSSPRTTTPITSPSHHHDEHHDLGHGHGHSHLQLPVDEYDNSVASAIRNLLIVVAISFHGIFEGLAIGLQASERAVWTLFLAVSLHECTILFCIGIELISAGTKVIRMITYILVVSMVCPVGIGIGIVISENAGPDIVIHALLVGSLQGIAAGTLLYVTFFEIFAAEGKNIQCKLGHILLAITGFVLMASLEFVGGHSHVHGHSHNITQPNQGLNPIHQDHHHHSHDHHHDHDSATSDDHVH